jgi:hypothetical protein
MEHQEPTRREREDNIGMMGERRRALESSEYVRGGQGSLERYGGLPRVVLLTPEGGQLINIGISRGFVFSVISQKTAARYAVHRSKLPEPVMVAGPAGQQVRATEHCTMAFPQEKAVGGKLIIYAFVVETLEELYETRRRSAEVADAIGRRRRGISAMASSCAARRPPVLRAVP